MKNKKLNLPAIIIFVVLVGIGIYYLLDFKYNHIDLVKLNQAYQKICSNEANKETASCQEFLASGGKITGTHDTLTVYYYLLDSTPLAYLNIVMVILVSMIIIYEIPKLSSLNEHTKKIVTNDYKKNKRKIYLNILKCTLVIPLSLFVLFIFCIIVTKGNFDATETIKKSIASFPSIYLNMGIKFFLLHIFSIFIMCLIYTCINFISAKLTHNNYIRIALSFILYLFIEFISYFGIGMVIFLNLFKIDITDYFNLMNQLNFYNCENYLLYIIIRISILIILIIINTLIYKNKTTTKMDKAISNI